MAIKRKNRTDNFTMHEKRSSERNPKTDRVIASKIGGIGVCGRKLCCASWLKNAQDLHVNLRMARKQNVSLTPENINGYCCHMKCCLSFEASEEDKRKAREAQQS